MIGPALAGVAISAFGIASAFWLNAASFLAVIASLLALRGASQTTPLDPDSRRGFREAVAFLRRTPGLRDLIAFSTLLTCFGMSAGTIYPAVADQVLHGQAGTLGAVLGASGAGALVGALVCVPLAGDVERVGLLAGGATIWAGAFLALFSLSTWLPSSLACLFLSGLAFPVVITTAVGILQLLGPREMRARLQSALLLVTFGIQPFAALATGWSARLIGAPEAPRLNALTDDRRSRTAARNEQIATRMATAGWRRGPSQRGAGVRAQGRARAGRRATPELASMTRRRQR